MNKAQTGTAVVNLPVSLTDNVSQLCCNGGIQFNEQSANWYCGSKSTSERNRCQIFKGKEI